MFICCFSNYILLKCLPKYLSNKHVFVSSPFVLEVHLAVRARRAAVAFMFISGSCYTYTKTFKALIFVRAEKPSCSVRVTTSRTLHSNHR